LGRTYNDGVGNKVHKRILGPKKQKVAEGWIQIIKYILLLTCFISSRMEWAGYVEHMEEMTNMYNILVGKPESKRLRPG
jgi:hypothetical protein